MPGTTYSLDTIVANAQWLVARLDRDGAAMVKLRSAAGSLLATIPLTEPSGTVEEATGQITYTVDAANVVGSASGQCATADYCTAAGALVLSQDAREGSEPVPGYFVMSSLAVIAGGPLSLLSAVAG